MIKVDDGGTFRLVTEAEGWDIDAVSRVLGAEPQPHRDLYAGDGYRLVLPELDAQVELYPDRFMARYSQQGVYLEMANARLDVDESVRLVTETEKLRAVVSMLGPEGTAIFSGPRAQPGQTKPEAEPEPRQVESPTNVSAGKETPRRVTLTGNVGRDAEVRTSPSGRKVLKFPLGVHEGERTTWHDILFFDDKAERVAAEISKGKLVTVIGYKHEREAEVKKGSTTIKKMVVEIFGAVVRTPRDPHDRVSRSPATTSTRAGASHES